MATILQPVAANAHVESDVLSDLTRFIEDQVRRQSDRFVLAQRAGDALQTVNEWLAAEMLDARSLAHVIYGAGLREAQALREAVSYGVFAFRADTPGPVGRFVFRIEAGSGWLAQADTPDERGLMAMLMRHTDSSARLSLGHSREIVDQYQTLLTQQQAHDQRLLEQAYARIRALEARESEALELHEKLQSHTAERDAQLEALRRKDEMRKFALEKLGPIVPIMVAKLLGGAPANETSVPPSVAAAARVASAHVGDELVDRLVQSLTPTQLGEVARLLTPEQLAIFGQLYDLVEARIRRAAGASAPTTSTTSDAAAVAGASPPSPSTTQAPSKEDLKP